MLNCAPVLPAQSRKWRHWSSILVPSIVRTARQWRALSLQWYFPLASPPPQTLHPLLLANLLSLCGTCQRSLLRRLLFAAETMQLQLLQSCIANERGLYCSCCSLLSGKMVAAVAGSPLIYWKGTHALCASFAAAVLFCCWNTCVCSVCSCSKCTFLKLTISRWKALHFAALTRL